MKRKQIKQSKGDSGFVLVESILSWTLLAIIGLTFAVLFTFGLECFIKIASRKEALSNARFAVNRITQELLPLPPSNLISISPTQISFKDPTGANTDFHSQIDSGATSLYRGMDLLAKNLSAFSFSYYDTDGNPINDYTNVAGVRRIQMDISVKDINSINNVSVRGEVYPRNFYYNNFQ
jgi:hypothetical protein